TDGDSVTTGDVIVVLEAMKMEQPLTAHKTGTVTGLSAATGQSVTAGAVICDIKDT
ncbi:acetyl-CoA carboxylase biotin carboxyl carrier protein subunit, partial [Streptosporangium album]